jgi:hypothetical protein
MPDQADPSNGRNSSQWSRLEKTSCGVAVSRLASSRARPCRLLAALRRTEAASRIVLRLRASILAISGQLSEYAPYFDDRTAQ